MNVSVTPRIFSLTVDCEDPAALSKWWADLFDVEVTDMGGDDFAIQVTDPALQITFQRVPDPNPGKNRFHLDLDVSSAAATADFRRRIEESGATHSADHDEGGFQWSVFQDPEGNFFCVGTFS